MHSRVALLLLLVAFSCVAQVAPNFKVPDAARKYLDILIKRPQPGTIFERFYAAWLEEGTAAELGAYLAAKTKDKASSAADHLLLAVYSAHRGDDSAALAAYEAALKIDPGNATAWIERSRLESRALDFAAALKSLDEAAKAKPDTADGMEIGKLRGRALLRLGKNEEALKVWKELAAAHAEDQDLAEELVDLLVDEGQYEAAIESAKALVQKSRDPVAKTLRGLRMADVLLLAERRDEALKTLREALAATGADSWIEGDVLGRMSRVFRMGDDVSGLEKWFAELEKEHPQRVALAWQHTQLLGETGQKDAALKEARALLQSNPGRRDLQEGFLDLLESLALIQEAVVQAQVLMRQNAGDKEMLVRLATLQHRAKNDAAAQATLEQFLEMPGAGENEHLRVARLLENWEEPAVKAKADEPPSPAVKAYARLVEKFPQSMSAQEAQAHYLHRSGQREAALVIWARLAKSAGLEDLLRVVQALQARLESRAALDVLMPREHEFATEARFYALMVQLAIANKELARALPWARVRLRLAKDAEAIETAVKDLLLIVRGDEEGKIGALVMQELQSAATLTIQERCLFAALLENAGKGTDAEKALNSAPEGDKLIALSQLAQLFQTRQDWEKAAQTLQQVIALPGARISGRVQRIVDCYRRAMKPEEALNWIAEWKKLSPSAVQPWLDESRLLQELNRAKDALSLLREAMRKFPDSIEVASSYATLCLENGQQDEAERTYLALYEKATDAAARQRLIGPLALAAQQRNGLPRLIENFQQRQQQNRASAQPWLALAEIHRATGNDEERRRCLYEASRLRPQDLELLHEIARSEEEVGLTAEALRTLDAAAKIDKTSKTRERIARLQIDSGDADTGYRMLFELAGGNQMDARSVEQMADTIAEKGEWERVIVFLEPLLPKHARDYRLHYLHAIALEEAGRERDAVRGFLSLMELHEELPGVVSVGRSIGLREQFKSRNLPPGVEDWLVLPGMMQYAYAHRQKAAQGSRCGYYGGYFGQQVNNGMPHGFIEHAPGVTESPVLALAHLLQIAGGWDAQERSAIVPQLKQAGVSDAALLLEAAENTPQLIITPEMLAAHPQNLTLHAVWLLQHQQGDPEELLPVYENAWKLFQTGDATQAQNIALRAWYIAGEKSAVWLTRLLDLVEKQTQPDAQAFQGIASLLQGQAAAVQNESQTTPRLTAAEIKRLADRLRAWYRAKPESYAATSIISALGGAQEWEGLVEAIKLALDKPKDKAAATPASAAQVARRYRGGWSGPIIQPQPFYLLPGFPPELASLADQMRGRRNYRDEFGEAEELPEAVKERLKAMQDGLRPFMAKADEPRLKFMLQLMCGEDAVLEKSTAGRLQAKDATADDFLTAGWLAQRANKPTEAFAHFTQALKLTTDANVKLMIENALLYQAQRFIQQEHDEAKTAPVRAQVKTLLEAHLQTAKSTDEKYQIAQVMSVVGLAEEAQAVEEAVRAAQNNMSTPARQRSTPVTNPYSSNRAYYQRQQQAQKTPEQLMQEGKRDLVVKEYVRQLRAAIQQTLSPQNGTSGHQQLHQVMDQAAKLNVWDDVAKVLRDSAAGGWRSRLEYAVMLEHVGNSSEPALAEHRVVIAANPRAYDSQVRLAVVLSYEGKFEEAVKHWRTVPAMLQEQHLQGIIQEFTQRHQYAVPQPEALSGLLCTWLRGLEANRPLSMQLVQHLVQALHSIEQADGEAPSLYQPRRPDPLSGDRQRWKLKADGTLDLAEAAAKNRTTRRQAHDDLCRAMLAVPELAQSAFPPLAALALEDGDAKALAELETTALDLLTRLTMPKVKRRLISTGYNNIYNSNNGVVFKSRNRIFMPDAALFLVRAAALRHGTHALDDTLYPLITRVQGKQRTAYLKGYADLLMAKEEGFITAAESWLKQQQSYAINNEGGAHDEVLRLWLERKITAPLDALYAPTSSAAYGYNIPHAVTAYVMALGQRNTEAMRQFVRKLRDQWLGTDADARHKVVAAWITGQNDQRRRNSYYRQPGSTEQAVSAYIQWLQNLLQQPRGLALLEIALEDGLDASPNWLRQIAYQHSNSDRLDTPELFLQSARNAGFLGDAAHFRAYDISEAGQSPLTWLGNLARQFRERGDDDTKINTALKLISQEPGTFGADLLQALLVKNGRTPLWLDGKPVPFEASEVHNLPASNLMDRLRGDDSFAYRQIALTLVLKRHAKVLAAMPEAGQLELALLLRTELSGYPRPEQLGEILARVLSPLLKNENAKTLRKVDAVLAAKTWNDIGGQEYVFTQQFPVLLRDTARLDSPKAAAAARHAVSLLRTSPEQKQTTARRNNETPVSRFLYTLAQVPQMLPVVFELAEADGLTNSPSWRSNLRSRVEQMANVPASATALLTSTPFVADTPAFSDLADMDDNEPTILAHIINAIENNDACAVAVREHLGKQPATFGTELLLAFLHREPGDDRYARSFYNSKRPNDGALLAFIQKRGPDFTKLQPETASSLLALFNARLKDLQAKAAQDTALQNALQPLVRADQTQFEAAITRWMQTNDLSDSGSSDYETIQSCERLLDRLVQSDKARAVALLDHISKLLAQEEVRNNGGQRRPPHQTSVANWLLRAITVPELFSEVRQRAEESGAAKDGRWLTEALRNSAQISKLRGQPARLIALLEMRGMLNPAATFDPGLLPAAEGQQPRTQLELMTTDFSSHPGLMEALQQRTPRTFGTDLLLLLHRSTTDERSVFARAHADEIAACSPGQQGLLAALIERRKWAAEFAPLVPAFADEIAPLLAERRAKTQAWLDELLKTKTWKDIDALYARSLPESARVDYESRMRMNGGQPYFQPGQTTPVIDHLTRQMFAVAEVDAVKARLAFSHATSLYQTEFGTGGDPYRKPSLDAFLTEMCRFPRLAPEVLKFAAQTRTGIHYSNQAPLTEYMLFERVFPPSTLANAEKTAATLADLGLLARAESYEPTLLPNTSLRSILGLALWRLEKLESGAREKLARALVEAKDAQFGHHLFATCISTPDAPEKASRLALCAAQFSKVPERSAGPLLHALARQFPGLTNAEKAEGELKPFAPLLELQTREERTYLSNMMNGRYSSQPYRGQTLVVKNEVARLVKNQAREELMKLLTGLRTRVESRSDNGRFLPSHDYYLSRSIDDMVTAGREERAMVFAGQMWAAAAMPGVRLTSSFGRSASITRRSLLFTTWEQRGGWAAPGAVFAQFIEEVAAHDMSGTTGLWLPVFNDMLMNLSVLERRQIAAWADAQMQPALRAIAHELKLAIALLETTTPAFSSTMETRKPVAGSAVAAKHFSAAAENAAALLRDEKIAPHIRLSLAGYLCGIYPGLLEDEPLLTWALAAAQAWSEGRPVTQFELESLLNAAAVLPVDDTWKKISSVVLARWNQREEIFRRTHTRHNTRSFYPAVLRFASRSGEQAVLNAFLQDKYAPREDYTRIRGILLECGAWKQAEALKLDSFEQFNDYDGKWHWWLPPAKDVLKAMHASNPEDSLHAEVMALCADDNATWVLYPKTQWSAHDERLAAFAKKLAAEPLPAQAVQRARTLVVLGKEHPAAALALLPQFEAVEKTFLSDSLGNGDTGFRPWVEFLGVQAALQTARNDFKTAETSFKLLQNDPKIKEHHGSDTKELETVFRGVFTKCLMRLWAGGLMREPAKLLKLSVYSGSPKGTESYSYACGEYYLSNAVFQSCLGGWNVSIGGGITSKPADVVVVNISSTSAMLSLVECLAAIAGSGKHRLSFQQRLGLFEHVAGKAVITYTTPSPWVQLVHHRFFTAEELVKNAAAIIRSTAFHVALQEDFARYLRGQGALSAAAEMFEKVAAQWDAGKQPRASSFKADSIHMERVALLIRLKNFDEARRCLEKAGSETRVPVNTFMHEALMKMLPPVPAPAK